MSRALLLAVALLAGCGSSEKAEKMAPPRDRLFIVHWKDARRGPDTLIGKEFSLTRGGGMAVWDGPVCVWTTNAAWELSRIVQCPPDSVVYDRVAWEGLWGVDRAERVRHILAECEAAPVHVETRWSPRTRRAVTVAHVDPIFEADLSFLSGYPWDTGAAGDSIQIDGLGIARIGPRTWRVTDWRRP